MAITYSLQPIPKWYFADKAGRPLAGGFMFTFSSLNKTQPKAVFQDAGGVFAWTNPIIFDANGEQGPFYWLFNSSTPDDLYFIEVYDSNLNLQWTIDGFGASGSGGGTVTTSVDITNLVANNVFYQNIGQTINPVPAIITLAPGAHSGLGGNALPDINFVKDTGSTATDQITFTAFPFGTNPIPGDVTPPYYLSYVCTSAGSENIKVVRYPITSNVKNLENQQITISFWARRNPPSNNPNISINFLQFFALMRKFGLLIQIVNCEHFRMIVFV